jgi:hypothetical protein
MSASVSAFAAAYLESSRPASNIARASLTAAES